MSEEERDTDHQGSSVPSRLREVSAAPGNGPAQYKSSIRNRVVLDAT